MDLGIFRACATNVPPASRGTAAHLTTCVVLAIGPNVNLLWFVIGAFLLWWLFRSPPGEEGEKATTEREEFTSCEVCGDTFVASELRTAPGVPGTRCPGCYAELQSFVRGLEREGGDRSGP